MKKFKSTFAGICIVDSVDTTKKLEYGKYFKDDLDEGEWTEDDIQENLDKFFAHNFGFVSAKIKELNDEHILAKKGNLTGVYKAPRAGVENMIIFYHENDDTIYILNQADFDRIKNEWLSGGDDVVEGEAWKKEETDKKMSSTQLFKRPGNRLMVEQKEMLRQEYPDEVFIPKKLSPDEIEERGELRFKLAEEGYLTKEEISRLNEIADKEEALKRENEIGKDIQKTKSEVIHYAGAINQREIDATRKIIETGFDSRGKNKLQDLPMPPEQLTAFLKEKAESKGHTYEEVIEEIAMQTQINHKNLRNSIMWVIKNIDKPYFFNDSEKKPVEDSKPDWLDDECIDDIIYDRAWPVDAKIVVNELIKKGLKNRDLALKYVQEYVENNPSEKDHIKF